MDDAERRKAYTDHLVEQSLRDNESRLRSTLNGIAFWKRKAAAAPLSPDESRCLEIEEENVVIEKADLARRGLPLPDWAIPPEQRPKSYLP